MKYLQKVLAKYIVAEKMDFSKAWETFKSKSPVPGSQLNIRKAWNVIYPTLKSNISKNDVEYLFSAVNSTVENKEKFEQECSRIEKTLKEKGYYNNEIL